MEDCLQLVRGWPLLPAILVASAALAADADNGKRIAEMRCIGCHIMGPIQRRDVTDAPPFELEQISPN
jgi:mono/diheme cytochrome c family protein